MRLLRRISLLCLASLCLGGLLFLIMQQGENLWLTGPMESLGKFLYRVVFIVLLPFRMVVGDVYPLHYRYGHDVRLAISSVVAAAAFLLTLLFFLRVFNRRRAAKLSGATPMSRRRFIAESLAAGAVTGATAIGSYYVLVAPQRIRVRNYEAPIKDLPADLDGLRIVQLSDTHYGPFMPLAQLRRVVEQVNEMAPDFVVLTGDYVIATPLAIRPGIEIMKHLKAPLGVAAVLGNHDYWEGEGACRGVFQDIGIPLLENTSMSLGRGGLGDCSNFENCICISGVTDLWEGTPDVPTAKAGVPEHVPTILLSHNPDFAEKPAARGGRVDLMLSGHTHGGQVRLPGWGAPVLPSKYGQKYAGGWVEGPHWPVIVSRGVGMVGFPVRFRVPPEICQVTLRQA